MQGRKDYLTATYGNGTEQAEASTRLIKQWIEQTVELKVPVSFLLAAENPLALLYVLERLNAVKDGQQFLANNPGQPKRAYRDHEIHRDVQKHYREGCTMEESVQRTRQNLAEGLSGMPPEVLSERSVKNVHARSSSMTTEEWGAYVIRRFKELGQTVIDDQEE